MQLTALLLLTLLLASCSPPTDRTHETRSSEQATERSEAQLRAVESGEGTAAEYEQAFREFQSCMSEGGFDVSVSGVTGEVYDYSFPQAAAGAGVYDRCYEFHFSEIDLLWQIAHEDLSPTTDLIKRCLQDRGIEPQETALQVNEQLREHGISFGDC